MPGIAYGIPSYRSQVHVGHVVQASALTVLTQRMGVRMWITWADTCSLDWARNFLIYWAAFKTDANWLIQCDSDTFHFNGDDIARMLEAGTKRDAAIIAAAVKLRDRKGHNAALLREGKETYCEENYFKGKVVEVDRIGTAFMAINCEWIRRCWPVGPWVQSRQVMTAEGAPGWMGEDYAFCDGVKMCRGGLILCDGRFEPAHESSTSEKSALVDMGALVISNGRPNV